MTQVPASSHGGGLPSYIQTDDTTHKVTFTGPVVIAPTSLPDVTVPALFVDAPSTAGASGAIVRIQHDEAPADTADVFSVRRKTGLVQHFAIDSGGSVEVGIHAVGSTGVGVSDFVGTGQPVFAGHPDITNHNGALNTVCGVQAAPAVPASTAPLANPFDFACIVTVRGGTVSQVAVDGTGVGIGDGVVVVPRGSTITLTYAVAPTWTWFGLS